MKQILYFLIGFLISIICSLPFAHSNIYPTADIDVGSINVKSEYGGWQLKQTIYIKSPGGTAEFSAPNGTVWLGIVDAEPPNPYGLGVGYAGIKGIYPSKMVAIVYIPTELQQYFSDFPDSDGDRIGDDFDLKPNSSDPYKAAIVSVCYDENNKVVAGIIQDGEGNQYQFGTMPTDFEGYTIDSVTGDLVTYQTAEDLAASLAKLDIDDLNITQKNSPVEIQDDGTIIPGSTDPFKDYKKAEDDQTQAKQPDTQQVPSEQPDSNDSDSGRLDKIIKNTSATNTNLENIQKYLGITNDYLAKINKKELETTVSVSGGGSVVSSTGPSADEIGQAVGDNLIDSGQTIDTTITDNIPALDETDTLTAIKTKYSDRYDLFITTVKESDLFSLPFDIFAGPSGSGSSVQTVDIGKWGSSSEQTASIDYSDYDNVWGILRSVLLLVTSFACFKILVLKKA
nr:hypothetical protein [uncultured Desulfobacter sp.]